MLQELTSDGSSLQNITKFEASAADEQVKETKLCTFTSSISESLQRQTVCNITY